MELYEQEAERRRTPAEADMNRKAEREFSNRAWWVFCLAVVVPFVCISGGFDTALTPAERLLRGATAVLFFLSAIAFTSVALVKVGKGDLLGIGDLLLHRYLPHPRVPLQSFAERVAADQK